MKRLGDPNEKKFEKIPRREQQVEESSSGDSTSSEDIELNEEMLMEIFSKQRVGDVTAPVEAGMGEFDFDELMRERIPQNAFGVFCVFALKEIGMDLDVISVIIPTIHLYSLWTIEMDSLEKLQSTRLRKKSPNCETITISGAGMKLPIEFADKQEKEEPLDPEFKALLRQEAGSMYMLGGLISDFGFNCEYTPRFLGLVMNNFKLESPYSRLIFNAAGWAMGQVLSAARDACEQAPGKLNLKFVSDVISTSTVTIASIFLCCYRIQMKDTFFLYLTADIMKNLCLFLEALSDLSVMESAKTLELIGGVAHFDNVMRFFETFSDDIDEEDGADLPLIVSSINAMAGFVKSGWGFKHGSTYHTFCSIGFSVLLADCEKEQTVDIDLAEALATGFKHLLPYYASTNDRGMIAEVVQFVAIVLPVEPLATAKIALIELMVEILCYERKHADLFQLQESPGKYVLASEYLRTREHYQFKQVVQKWLLEPEEEFVCMQAEMSQLLAGLNQLMDRNQSEWDQLRREGKIIQPLEVDEDEDESDDDDDDDDI